MATHTKQTIRPRSRLKRRMRHRPRTWSRVSLVVIITALSFHQDKFINERKFMFKVIGISTLNGVTKVRFANDMVSRVKILNKDGHKDINLIELTAPLSKADAVKHLKTTDLYAKFSAAIDAADAKYNGSATVKVSKPSLEAIKARAGITTPEVA